MKRKARVRLFSALLTLAMLAGLMPAAFAAEQEYDAALTYSMDRDETATMQEIGFLKTALYKTSSAEYFCIQGDKDNGSYAPYVCLDNQTYDNVLIKLSTIRSVYLDTDDAKTGTYTYYIYGYKNRSDAEKNQSVGVVTLTLKVEKGASNSSGDDLEQLYLDTDASGYAKLESLSATIRALAEDSDELRGAPISIYIDRCSNGEIYYGENSVTESDTESLDRPYSFADFEKLSYKLDEGETEGMIQFTVYSDRHTNDAPDFVGGVIYINTDAAATITYKTDYNTQVYFNADDFNALLDSGYEIDYVKFSGLPSSKTVGALTLDDSNITSRMEIYEDELDEISFTPLTSLSGQTVTVNFTIRAVKSSTGKSARTISGTVAITVGSGGTLRYSAEMEEAVYLDAEDFAEAFEIMTDGQELVYVTFGNLPSKTVGALYVTGDTRDTAVSSTTKYYYEADSKQKALNDVYFEPYEDFSGVVTFTYDAYGSKSSYHVQGDIVVTITAGELDDVVYKSARGEEVTLDAADFSDLQYIIFHELPSASDGTLYYNYREEKANNSKVNTSTQYKTGKSGSLISNVTFVPASGASGTVAIPYTGYDRRGNMYTGVIQIKTFEGKDTVLTYSTTGTAAEFDAEDFIDACAKKLDTTLDYVQFTLPSASQGTLYYGYGSVQQTRVSTSSKYAADTHLNYVSFLPKAGFSGTVTIRYKGCDTKGETYAGSIQVTVTPPTKSSYFTDANVSWVAPAADFLKENGVYSGVVSGSKLGVGTAITRGEVMQMIYNAFNLKNQASSATVVSSFSDVPSTHANYTAINVGYALGIAQGYDGAFRPDDPITRQDACTLLYRAFTELGLSMSTGSASDLRAFSDNAKVSDYAVNAVAGMVKSGIIVGDENGINPLGNLTRGEMSVIVHRAMTL